MKKRKLRIGEKSIESLMLVCAFISVIAVLLITYLIFAEGLPIFSTVSVWDFLSGTTWKPSQDIYGILPMIVGSVYTTAIALLIGIPVGLGCAIFFGGNCTKAGILGAAEMY